MIYHQPIINNKERKTCIRTNYFSMMRVKVIFFTCKTSRVAAALYSFRKQESTSYKCFLNVHLKLLQSVLQLHRITSNCSYGAQGKSVCIGTSLLFPSPLFWIIFLHRALPLLNLIELPQQLLVVKFVVLYVTYWLPPFRRIFYMT